MVYRYGGSPEIWSRTSKNCRILLEACINRNVSHKERLANLLPPTPLISYVEQIGIHTWILSGGVHV